MNSELKLFFTVWGRTGAHFDGLLFPEHLFPGSCCEHRNAPPPPTRPNTPQYLSVYLSIVSSAREDLAIVAYFWAFNHQTFLEGKNGKKGMACPLLLKYVTKCWSWTLNSVIVLSATPRHAPRLSLELSPLLLQAFLVKEAKTVKAKELQCLQKTQGFLFPKQQPIPFIAVPNIFIPLDEKYKSHVWTTGCLLMLQ